MADETQGKGEGTADFLTRIARGLLDRMGPGGGAGPAAAPPAGPPLDPRLAPHGDKVTTAAEAVAHIPGGSHVFVGTARATPRAKLATREADSGAGADPASVEGLRVSNMLAPGCTRGAVGRRIDQVRAVS